MSDNSTSDLILTFEFTDQTSHWSKSYPIQLKSNIGRDCPEIELKRRSKVKLEDGVANKIKKEIKPEIEAEKIKIENSNSEIENELFKIFIKNSKIEETSFSSRCFLSQFKRGKIRLR